MLPNDLFLLCTDGLCGLVGDHEIAKIFRWGGSAEVLCGNLVSAALDKGGHDNVTVQVVRFENERVRLDDPVKEVNPIVTAVNIKSIATVVFFIVLVALLGAGIWLYLSN